MRVGSCKLTATAGNIWHPGRFWEASGYRSGIGRILLNVMDSTRRLVIMSWDPGGTTGWAALSLQLRHIQLFAQFGMEALTREVLGITSGQLAGSEETQTSAAFDLVQAGVDSGRADYIIFLYEDFILRKYIMTRALLAPVRMTSRLETINFIHWGFAELKQQPSLAKTATPDKLLRAYKLYTPGQPHANDAKRHGITLVRRFAAKPKLLEALLQKSQWLNG